MTSYALAADGTLYVWGGDTGDGDYINRPTPTQILPPAGYTFTSIAGNPNGETTLATVAPVPEPATLSLLALGGLAILRARWGGVLRRRSGTGAASRAGVSGAGPGRDGRNNKFENIYLKSHFVY